MTNIYLVFTCHMFQLSKTYISRVHVVSPALAFIVIFDTYMLVLSCGKGFIFYFYAFIHSKSKQGQMWYIPGIYKVNVCHTPLIYLTQYNFY
jgi:hypothetical protein